MARKPRDYKAEYARRIESGRKRGHSRARSRGHRPSRKRANKRDSASIKERLDLAWEMFRDTRNLTRSAREAKISTERFRLFIRENALAKKTKNQWRLLPDKRRRQIEMLSTAGPLMRVENIRSNVTT